MYRELIRLVERFKRPRLAVVGDLMLDRYVFGDAERISPEAPIQILRASGEETRLGGAGSVVNNLLALGADVAVFGVLGADVCGNEVLQCLRAAGARTAGALRVKGRPTTIKTRFVGRASTGIRSRSCESTGKTPPRSTAPSSAGSSRNCVAFLKKADAVVISDYNKGVLTPHLTQQVIRLARARRLPVLIDPIKDRDYAKYRGATLITPNRLETSLASGVRLTGPEAVRTAARRLLEDLRLQAVVVTLDKDGAYLAPRGKPGQMVPTRPRLVYDVAGAGDMVISVLAMAVASGAPLVEAVQLANIAGGLEVQKFGVQTVSREEIVAELLEEAHKSGDKVRSPRQPEGGPRPPPRRRRDDRLDERLFRRPPCRAHRVPPVRRRPGRRPRRRPELRLLRPPPQGTRAAHLPPRAPCAGAGGPRGRRLHRHLRRCHARAHHPGRPAQRPHQGRRLAPQGRRRPRLR